MSARSGDGPALRHLVFTQGDVYRSSMRLTLNGEHKEVPDGATVADLIVELELTRRRIAVEVNRDIVPRDVFSQRALREGDVVEVVQFIGGG